jgi:hypothetical protein
MNPFQNIDFRSVNDFLGYLPSSELLITERLRSIIQECIPDAKEKLAYNVPFYYRYARICFIWPSSVPWGNIKDGVLIGFCKGYLLSDVSYLETGTRKEVYTKTFYSPKEIDVNQLKQLLYEAVVIDEDLYLNKKQIKNSRTR